MKSRIITAIVAVASLAIIAVSGAAPIQHF